ncbi:MAG TPA: preprotein translocase subunit SecG [bacterium]|nr:preprotein translocase subunit SecG [bacterium]
MYTFLIAVHVLVAITLIVVILMQSSKGGGLSGAFGGAGGGSQSLFGGRGAASFLQKVTVGLAVMFMLLALVINLIGRSGEQQRSVVQESAQQQEELAPGTSLPKPGAEGGGQGLLPVEGSEPQQQSPAPDQQSNESNQ